MKRVLNENRPTANQRLRRTTLRAAASALTWVSVAVAAPFPEGAGIVDTGQDRCFDNTGEIPPPRLREDFFGQDAQYQGRKPAYRDNGNGTVTDLHTHLTWSKAVESQKLSPEEAEGVAENMDLGGYRDWRIPDIKELYSLIDFRGYTGFGPGQGVPANAVPFINTDFFDFKYGDIRQGERYIDAQWLSSTMYVSTTMLGDKTVFGVNFADGRIKGYGYRRPGMPGVAKRFYVRYVRGPIYGVNQFVDHGNGTVSDLSSGLMWDKSDSGKGMVWEDALRYAKNHRLAGYDDWRLPNAKELQAIVDYSRSPDTTNSPAMDPMFLATSILNEAGQRDFPYYWTSTTHLDGPRPGDRAVYIAFGRAMGQMHGRVLDVHGAGAQRSDPKTGTPQLGRGPQGDAQRIFNFVRVVRGGHVALQPPGFSPDQDRYPNNTQKLRLTPLPNQQEPTASIPSPSGPPPEAIAACRNKNPGMTCGFMGYRHELLTGVCSFPPPGRIPVAADHGSEQPASGKTHEPGNLPLACRPLRRGSPGHMPRD
ncbi:MAG: DUF1566 domain-containing protein [Magnetococcales bacterium]|nr:DUF1566 domain-containing protein [Magnetococcales bacterium]